MGSLLANEWRPPRTQGQIPADYHGPIYYRSLRLSSAPAKKSLAQYITFENKKIDGTNVSQRLSVYITVDDLRLRHPAMFDGSGDLKSDWREPLTAKRKSSFPKHWRDCESFQLCSGWVRDAIEALEPGVHRFIPVRLIGGGLADELIYLLIYGNGGQGFVALSSRSNPTQHWLTGGKHLRQTTEFAYLAADRVQGKHIFWCEVAYVWSKALIDRIGDVFAEQVALVPMGVAEP